VTVLEKKVCMMGAPSVGKTSLVRRYVESIFSDKYLATVGVKIDRRLISVGDQSVSMMLWDLQGEERYQWVRLQYLRGASGYVLVADGTRRATLEIALGLQENAAGRVPDVPYLLLLNKADLRENWDVDPEQIEELQGRGWSVLETSAKTGAGVEEAFTKLAERMLS
jgi:small GTP-binding protein